MEQCSEVYVGADAAKMRNAIAVADGECGGEVRYIGEIDAAPECMRRLVKRLAAKHERLHLCNEAGPTGYGLYRLITDLGHPCTVVAPSLIPRKPGDRVKTSRRDALALTKLLRVGEFTAVWVRDEGYEAMRDLVRARAAALESQRVHRQQVSTFMLEHGRIYPRRKGWTMRYLHWLQEQRFEHPAHQIALQEMVEAVRFAKERVARIEAAIAEFVPSWSLGTVVEALQTLRGIDLIVAVTFVTEIASSTSFCPGPTRAHPRSKLWPENAATLAGQSDRVNRVRNSASDWRNPSSVSTTDLARPTGSAIGPLVGRRTSTAQSKPFQVRRSS